jgi:DNA-binding GntR family transcriptional regulator
LQQLAWEDIIVSEPRKGYRLAHTSEQDVYEIYHLRARLEPYALELSGIPSEKIVVELVRLNQKIVRAKSQKTVVELDEAWHLLLISNCPNKRLLKMIKNLQRQSKRYEYTYFRINDTVQKSTSQHEKILEHLKNSDLKKAVRAFEENIMVGVPALIQSMQSEKHHHEK